MHGRAAQAAIEAALAEGVPQRAITAQRLPLSQEVVDFKTGLFTTRGRLGRALQAGGSYLLPGDLTGVTSPGRSTVYQAATPGGGSGRLGRRIGGTRVPVRCPVGYEFGGRFAGRSLSNCGRRLFVPVPGSAVDRAGDSLVRRLGRYGGAPGVEGREIAPGTVSGRAVQIARNAQIPSVGALNAARRDSAVAREIQAASNDDEKFTRLVRRDGVVLAPSIGTASLAGMRDNPDMDGATLVTRSPGSFGNDEVPVLLSTSLRQVAFAGPNGSRGRLTKRRNLSSEDRRNLSRTWRSLEAEDSDPGARVRKLAAASNGALGFEESGTSSRQSDDGIATRIGTDLTKHLSEVRASGDQETARRAIVDYLVDRRGDRVALAGADPAEARRRRQVAFAAFMRERSAKLSADAAEKRREDLLRVYDRLLERARSFNWDEYLAKLREGGLSANEETHFRLVAALYRSRLAHLKQSRERFLTILSGGSKGLDRIGLLPRGDSYQDAVEFKTMAARNEAAEATLAFAVKHYGMVWEEKAVATRLARAATPDLMQGSLRGTGGNGRALWDPDMAGGNGGWRCPPGTRYAGRWTDRLGSDCGARVSRRLADAVGRVAERLGDAADVRRDDRVVRRVRRRVQRGRAADRVGALADRLDPDRPRRERRGTQPAGRLARAADRVGQAADRVDPDRPRQRRGANPQTGPLGRAANRAGNVADRLDPDRPNRRVARRATPQRERQGEAAPAAPARPATPAARPATAARAEVAANAQRVQAPDAPEAPARLTPEPRPAQPAPAVGKLNMIDVKRRVEAMSPRQREAMIRLIRAEDRDMQDLWRRRLPGGVVDRAAISTYIAGLRDAGAADDMVNHMQELADDYTRLRELARSDLDRAHPSVFAVGMSRIVDRRANKILDEAERIGAAEDKAQEERTRAIIERAKAGGAPQGGLFDIPDAKIADPARGEITVLDENGFPRSKVITNPGIKSEADAIAFVKAGGSLDEVPNEFWLRAMHANASYDSVDTNSRFLRVRIENPGVMGKTRIFMLRGEDGKSTGQGWVVKSVVDNQEVANEVIGNGLAVAHGLIPAGAGVGGMDGNRPYVIIPHGMNGLPDGKVRTPNDGNYRETLFRDLPDRAYPQVLANVIHNFTLAAYDRHWNNSLAYRIGNRPFVVPMDYGHAGQVLRGKIDGVDTEVDDLDKYTRDGVAHWMGFAGGRIGRIKTHLDQLPDDQRQQQAEALNEVYDGMLARSEQVVARGREAFVDAFFGETPGAAGGGATLRLQAERMFDIYVDKVSQLRANRDKNLRLIGVLR